MKLYSRRGDQGITRLLTGPAVAKHSLRIEALGTVDELNCVLGWAGVKISENRQGQGWADDADARSNLLNQRLEAVQRRLFDMSAELACPDGKKVKLRLRRIRAADVQQLERWIDEIWGKLPPLKEFILPGGSEAAARLHVARAICRRAERVVTALAAKEKVNPHILAYLNRLADLLFALARWANQQSGVTDRLWKGAARKRKFVR